MVCFIMEKWCCLHGTFVLINELARNRGGSLSKKTVEKRLISSPKANSQNVGKENRLLSPHDMSSKITFNLFDLTCLEANGLF